MPRLAWTMIFLFVLPCVAGMTGVCHCAHSLDEIGSHELLARLASNRGPSYLPSS
jgi:hypothetical protein